MNTFADLQAIYPRWKFHTTLILDSSSILSNRPRSVIVGYDGTHVLFVTSPNAAEAWGEVVEQVKGLEDER